MRIYLAVSEFNKCRLVAVKNPNISENEIIERMLKDGEILKRIMEEELPSVSVNAWVWNEETQSIDVDEMLIPPEIVGARNSMTELKVSEIREMGTDYLMMLHAIEENNTGLINQMLMQIETAKYMAAPKVRFILEESGYKTLPK